MNTNLELISNEIFGFEFEDLTSDEVFEILTQDLDNNIRYYANKLDEGDLTPSQAEAYKNYLDNKKKVKELIKNRSLFNQALELSQERLDKVSSESWVTEEPRAFGYEAYCDATGGDFSGGGCHYCGGNGWNCC